MILLDDDDDDDDDDDNNNNNKSITIFNQDLAILDDNFFEW